LLKLRLDTTYLDLAEGESLSLTVTCPLFDQDGAEALFSFPFRLPATPRNLAALSHANRLDNADNTTTYTNCALEIEGLPFEPSGVLELDDQAFTADTITAVFRNQVPDLDAALEKIKIHEILDEITVTGATPDAFWAFDQTAASPALFQIGFGGTQYSFNPPGGTLPSAIAENLTNQINAAFPGSAVWVPGQEQIKIYSAAVNEEGINLVHLNNIALDSVTTTGQAQLAQFKNYLDDLNATPQDSHCFPLVRWYLFYKGDETRLGFLNWVNYALDSAWVENQPSTVPAWFVTFVPMVKLPYVFQKIADNSGGLLSSLTGYFEEADIQQLILFNNRSLDALAADTYNTVGTTTATQYLNCFKTSFLLNDHVPQMTAKELLLIFLRGFACWRKTIGTTLEIIKKQDMLLDGPIDWTSLAEPNYTATRNLREGFTLEFPEFEDRYTDPTQLQDFVSGDGEPPFTLPFHTAHMSTQDVLASGGTLKAPVVRQSGTSDEGGVGENSYSTRLLFFRGMQPTTSVDTYPYATHDTTDANGDPLGDLSLDLNAVDGLYELHHKGILGLLADGQPITLAMRLSIADILTARQWTNARRTITLPEGQVTAVIKSIKFKADANGLGISLVEFVQEK